MPATTPEEHDLEAEIAAHLTNMFREAMRAVSATDPRGALLNTMREFTKVLEVLRRSTHSFYYLPVFDIALQAFRDPLSINPLDEARLDLARAGMRFLATRTQTGDRPPSYNSRLAGDERNFDARFERFLTRYRSAE